MLENEILSIISQIGFPIAITIYLLLSRDKIIERNTVALDKLSDVVVALCNEYRKS
jgi:hypothetical protein